MWNFFVACFDKFLFDEVEFRQPKVSNIIYTDELNKEASSNKLKTGDQRFANSKPLLWEEDGKDFERSLGSVKEKEAIRVKVMMTKQEAARLLSKCKDGGVLEFKDVARELVQIPTNRVSVVPHTSKGAKLKSILEEF